MPRYNYSQNNTATNPVTGNGYKNILLQGSPGGGAGQMTMSAKELIKILDEIIDPDTETTEVHLQKILEAEQYFQELAADLQALYGALKNNTNNVQTFSLEHEGKKMPTGPELAKSLRERLITQMKMKENTEVKQPQVKAKNYFNLVKFAAEKGKGREERDKKKTRGNPFRVLMGQVGKLLDHGISKKDIVRYIAKKNMWNEETISKAVDVVTEYSKKKRAKEKKFQDKEASSQFNLKKIAAKEIEGSIYDVEPDFSKRSTAELMARASWLNDLLNYGVTTPQGDGRKVANKDGVTAELNKIRAVLKNRDFDKNELP